MNSDDIDAEVGTIGVCMRAIETVPRDAHRRMIEFLWDKYVIQPAKEPTPVAAAKEAP